MSMAAKGIGTLKFLLTCWKLNLASAMEYRLSFFMLAGMMFINNFMWLFFWSLFFGRFQVVNGWDLSDVMMLWAVGAGGFGWANMLFGNFNRIAPIVSGGQLDVYLSQPKPVLLHVLASRMSLTAVGDFMFGLVIYGWVGDHSLRGALLFTAGLIISGVLIMAVTIIGGCLSFYVGNSEGIANQVFNSFLALSTYPSDIFRGFAKALLFSIIPAGFISYLPIGLMRDFDAIFVLEAVAVTLGFLGIGIFFFHRGLRKYSSGNAIALRG
ncbi:ABC-2 type transport system permease protein [Paenibacillus taihuensis]|uniref:ABC-2 type transport system permease protein n=1 Tax=Paenibacillus taihuensis TaxID=1156355 RepID=A0A3D9SDK3_9BACL|nr:ABC-2 family transporter protein [Paenibacillus taihuensis]REE92946.1 ABC-2 type transport system permease protein [Paenibacillus taihuensis]